MSNIRGLGDYQENQNRDLERERSRQEVGEQFAMGRGLQ